MIELIKQIIEDREQYLKNPELLEQHLREHLAGVWPLEGYNSHRYGEVKLQDICPKIMNDLTVTDDEIFEFLLEAKLSAEFYGQINNICHSAEKGQIELQIKGEQINISLQHHEKLSIQCKLSLDTEVVYIDNPFVLDTLGSFFRFISRYSRNYASHREQLQYKLTGPRGDSNIIDEIIATKKLVDIMSIINTVCSGDLVRTGGGAFVYREAGQSNELNIVNLSAGLKTLVVIKTLLKNGSIGENGTIVLDEPEIHLHPQWQLILAEILVLLQKEFNLHILVNTHSPYFLNAIEVYADKHVIADKCKYYLAYNEGKISYIEDGGTNIDKIYKQLVRPLQKLEDEMHSGDEY